MPGINDPHPNEAEGAAAAVADPEDFFAPPAAPEGSEGAEAEAGAEADPGPEEAEVVADEVPVAERARVAEAEVVAEQAASTEDDDKGNRREYVVLQEITLDKETLDELLKQVKGGIEPLVALVEVHRANVTTAVAALRGAWNAHRDQWDAPPRLAAVSAGKLKVRTMTVKTREVTGFDFND